MKKSILILMLMVAMLPLMANAYEQLADGVYQDGSTLYIGSGVTSLGNLQVNPTTIYCYATIPPACSVNTFTGYGAALHVPASAMVNYFSAQYWYNFTNLISDAVEPESLTLNKSSVDIVIGQQFSLNATVLPTNATPNTVIWSSSNTEVATVNGGIISTVAPGECDIFARCADKQAVCHVIVLTERVTITLNKHEARLLPNHMLTLTATCSPMPTDLIVLSSDNTVAIPRLVDGTIQVLGLKEGTATITVASVDGTANTDACVVTVYTEVGDVNSDGYVNISDITELIDFLLSGNIESINTDKADTDRDGRINISDVTSLIDYLLGGGFWPWDAPNEDDWVDLGLPSGTLWATRNVGADRPEDYGDYFAWGETTPKDVYNWNTYKWTYTDSNGHMGFSKYNCGDYVGMVDNKTELDLEDDAAYVNWGPWWCMPTKVQQDELHMKCNWTRTTQNGVNGYLVTGPNGNKLFLPAAGYRYNNSTESAGLGGYFKSSTLYPSNSDRVYNLYFYMENVYRSVSQRLHGETVRAVRLI